MPDYSVISIVINPPPLSPPATPVEYRRGLAPLSPPPSGDKISGQIRQSPPSCQIRQSNQI